MINTAIHNVTHQLTEPLALYRAGWNHKRIREREIQATRAVTTK